MAKSRLWAAVLAMALLLSGCRIQMEPEPEPVALTSAVTAVSARQLSLDRGAVLVTETERREDGVPLARRDYQLPWGDRVVMGRASLDGGAAALEELTLPAGEGSLRYYIPEHGQWVEKTLAAGVYYASTVEIVVGDTAFFCYLPKTYQPAEHNTLIYEPDSGGALVVRKAADGWQLTLAGQAPAGTFLCDYTYVLSGEPLLDWFHQNYHGSWYNYTQDGAGKWCFDGYYRTSPETYAPTGENSIYRCPASYVVDTVTEAMEERESAAALAVAMTDTLARLQNSQGFWETGPESLWLREAYGAGPGFYDTRFNTELADIFVTVCESQGGTFLRAALERYAAFYGGFAQNHHQETESGGWLVEDYWSPDTHTAIHTSLNHQLAECLVLYRMADALEREDLAQLADRLLLAVEDTGMRWVNDAGDLHYSRSAEGVYDGTDYPFLTYNDLLALNGYLRARTGEDNETLTALMAAKRAWMDRNGVTGYDREPEEEELP